MKIKGYILRTIENEDKLSLEFCKKIMNQSGNDYSDEEILRIRDYLYHLAELEARKFNQWQTEQTAKIIELNNDNYEAAKSHSLHPGEYRRAS